MNPSPSEPSKHDRGTTPIHFASAVTMRAILALALIAAGVAVYADTPD
jgi:hypothetical protein